MLKVQRTVWNQIEDGFGNSVSKTLEVLISKGFYRLFYGSHLYSSGRKTFDEQIATFPLFTLRLITIRLLIVK